MAYVSTDTCSLVRVAIFCTFTRTPVCVQVGKWPFLFCIRLGNLGKTYTGKLFRNFKWLKNREDGSDFDDFGPNESQRCQLNFEKFLGRRKKFREGEKFEKLSRKVRKILARTRFLGRNKIEMANILTPL